MERDIIASSPCAGVKPQRLSNRATGFSMTMSWAISGAALTSWAGHSALWSSCCSDRPANGARQEIARMEWSVDLQNRLWTLPKSAARTASRTTCIERSPLSRSLDVAAAARLATPSYSPRATSRHRATTVKTKKRLDALLPADTPPWRLHDLRRTVASGMARLGTNLPVIEKVLDHSSGSFSGDRGRVSTLRSPPRSARRWSLGASRNRAHPASSAQRQRHRV